MKAFSRSFFPAAVCAAVLSAGCASVPLIKTSPDPQVDYTRYHTFTVVPNNQASTNTDVTPVLLRTINEEVVAAFGRQGLTQATNAGAADLAVLPHGAIENKIDVTDWGFGYGHFRPWGWGWRGGRGWGPGYAGPGPYELEQYKEGTLLIDVFDNKTKALVWRGSAQAEVEGPPNPEKVRQAIDQVVSRYPH